MTISPPLDLVRYCFQADITSEVRDFQIITPATKSDTAVDTIVSTAVSLFYREKHRQNKHLQKQALHFGSIPPILQRFFAV